MVNTVSKSGSQKQVGEPLIRTPPKRNFSETLGGSQTLLIPEQQKKMTETPRGSKFRKPNPSLPKLDAKTMLKLVPTLSERELKQLVSTIVRRRKREEAQKKRRPSEPASDRDSKPGLQKPLVPPEPSHTEMRYAPEAALDSQDREEEKTQESSRTIEEQDLASALLRQASRQCLSSWYFFRTTVFKRKCFFRILAQYYIGLGTLVA